MTSTHDIQIGETSELRLLNSGSNILTVTSSNSMSSDIPFVFPPDTGTNNYLLTTDGSNVTSWTDPANVTAKFPPVANDNIVRCRTNELKTISVLGNDTNGGSLTSPSLTVSLNSNTSVSHGTLTHTGGGVFTYRSFPRFFGLDKFTYNIVDSSGIVSKRRATVYINVEKMNPIASSGDPGPYITYGRENSANIYYYKDGTETVLHTATYPTYVGSTTNIGINNIAVNRDDNLIYYTAHDASTNNNNHGRIYAWDYVNDIEFLLVNARTDSAFSDLTPSEITFNGGGAVYYKGKIYIGRDGSTATNDYLVISVDQYYITGTSTPNQDVAAAQVTFGQTFVITSLAWDYHGGNLVVNGIDGGTTTRTSIVDSLTGRTKRTYTYTGTADSFITASYNRTYYTNRHGSTALTDISLYNGQTFVTQPVLDNNDVTDLGEGIIELQPA